VAATVVYFAPSRGRRAGEHETATQTAVARLVAEVKGCEFGGVIGSVRRVPPYAFIVARDTLLAPEAAALGIRTADDFFGGVVPDALATTKAITHDLVSSVAVRPAGWRGDFAEAVADCVLPGFTAFSPADARVAVHRLLALGPVRLKPARGAGGRGQRVAHTPEEAEAAIGAVDARALAGSGLVLEANLADVVTYSIGQVRLDGQTVSYVGTQAETRDNAGRRVYGGSELTVVPGGWDALRNLPDPVLQLAVEQAGEYDAATAVLPGFIASRRNYDVVAGTDGGGQRRVGVLEASWRPGGASPAEIVAFRALRDDQSLAVVRVSTVERYGEESRQAPDDALVHFQGSDSAAGPVLRYTRIVEARAA
jgi:hypothetical protein